MTLREKNLAILQLEHKKLKAQIDDEQHVIFESLFTDLKLQFEELEKSLMGTLKANLKKKNVSIEKIHNEIHLEKEDLTND